MASPQARSQRRARAAPAALSLLLLSLAAALPLPHVSAAVQRDVRVPGSARTVQLYAPSQEAFTSPAGSRPLILLLRALSCIQPPAAQAAALAAAPGAQQFLASHFSLGFAIGPVRDDVAALARDAADRLGAITATLTAPRSTPRCSACPAIEAAARVAPPGAERDFTLATAAFLANATQSGVDCPAWDATPACCQASPQPRGDVDFLLGAIDAMLREAPAANRSAVVAMGFSAGAFMALRLACDAPAGRVAAVVAYAGADFADARRCAPQAPVPVLTIHGRNDLEVPYQGAPANYTGEARVPGAETTLAAWARRNRCGGSAPRRNALASNIERIAYEGCGAPTQGWFVADWGHLPPRSAQNVFLEALRTALQQRR
jgi:pimeloyl-ACP methyl ester carboxylesterase